LIEVLKKGSCLVRSDAVEVRRSDGTVVKANEKAELPEPKVGKIEKTNLYIEYSF